MIERWNGKKWAAVRTPNPHGTDNFLDDVNCTSTRQCYAVGGFGSEATSPGALTPLLERWNGKKWAIEKAPPFPAGAQSANLSALNCVSGSRCLTVGTEVPKGGFDSHVYSDVLRGKKWSQRTVPQPFHGHFAYAADADVTCVSATSCWMAGAAAPDAQGRTAYTPEAWRYHGKSWRLMRLPKALDNTSAGGGELSDVTCAAATTCWFVGNEYVDSGSAQEALALRWHGGKSFAVAKVAQPADSYDALDAVGCVHHGACYALGQSNTATASGPAFADRTG